MRPSRTPGASMAAQLFVTLLVGIAAAAILAFVAADAQKRAADRHNRDQRLEDRVADLAFFLAHAPAGGPRPGLLGAGPEAPRWATPGAPAGPADQGLTARLADRLGPDARVFVSLPRSEGCGEPPPPRAPPPPPAGTAAPPPPTCRTAAFTLGGERMTLILPTGPRPPHDWPPPINPTYLVVVAAAAGLLAYLVAMLATAPLRRLARAARDLGRDLDHPPLPLEGPSEVREAARAFNAMQARLKRNLEERTHMLAAITHDLQTPLTRQRLRLEKVSDPTLRRQLLADHQAMRDLIRDGLDLARASGAAEQTQELDLDSLLQSLASDAVEAGQDVTVVGGCRISVRTRPQALRRCVANLVDNAVKYAGAAELSAERDGEAVVLRVRDHGPGIPPEELEAVLRPFVRLETSRSRETGGVGLGLTIARILAERAGGSLRLRNHRQGLEAIVRLG